jgi:hypothetical protein
MHAVSVRVIAPVAFECKFWIDSGGWHAVADGLDITVQGGSFEDTKRSMESALNAYVESLVRKPYATSHKITA